MVSAAPADTLSQTKGSGLRNGGPSNSRAVSSTWPCSRAGEVERLVNRKPNRHEVRDDESMDEQPLFSDAWWDLREGSSVEREQRQALHAELLTEVVAGHPLHGQPIDVVARSETSDDIIVQLGSQRWARIHLTWKGAAETPPWPKTTFHDTVEDLERGLPGLSNERRNPGC